jgi:hypothetical protein
MFLSGFVKPIFGHGVLARRRFNEFIDEKGYIYALIGSVLYSLNVVVP